MRRGPVALESVLAGCCARASAREMPPTIFSCSQPSWRQYRVLGVQGNVIVMLYHVSPYHRMRQGSDVRIRHCALPPDLKQRGRPVSWSRCANQEPAGQVGHKFAMNGRGTLQHTSWHVGSGASEGRRQIYISGHRARALIAYRPSFDRRASRSRHFRSSTIGMDPFQHLTNGTDPVHSPPSWHAVDTG